ncbi:MAG: hypothetical protein CMH57_09340 [Myxococcales bacterium]|nr:hypothetical protein [Myxococcales bacterium]
MAEPSTPPSPSPPDPARVRRLALFVAAAALVMVAISFIDVSIRHTRANPFEPGADLGVPPIAESPWHPMRHLDPSRLPWTLDPMEGWPAELREAADAPCGLARVLRARYGAWLPDAARRGPDPVQRCAGLTTPAARREALEGLGFQGGDPGRDGPLLLRVEDGWVLERLQQGQYELAVVQGRGLVLRRAVKGASR